MKSKNFNFILYSVFIVIAILLIAAATLYIANTPPKKQANNKETDNVIPMSNDDLSDLDLTPKDFTSTINNKYLTFTPGTAFIYKGETEEGTERIEVYATHETKKVMGVETLVVWDRVWLNDELIEDTKDWYAQDKYGNVWYFGEESKDLVNGKIVSTKGSWQAGVNGAQPGIIMKANPKIGDSYYQEYYEGEAEDMGEVIALGVQIKVQQGTYTNCLQTKDWNPLEPGDDEYKYYCPKINGLVYETSIEDGEAVQLIDIMKNIVNNQPMQEPQEELLTNITQQQAREIAQKAVQGTVTDVAIEKKFGKPAYVVEIKSGGREKDIIIDIETGAILGIET